MTKDCKEFIWSCTTVLIWLVLIAYAYSCIGCSTIQTVKQMEDYEKTMMKALCSDEE